MEVHGERHHCSFPWAPVVPPPSPLTFKEGADPAPGCHPSLAGVLAQRRLQEEDRDPAGEEEDEVGDEEGTWQIQGTDRKK